MRTLGKREWIAVSVALVAAGILFFGGNIWNFLYGGGLAPVAEPIFSNNLSENPTSQKMANISTVSGLEVYDLKIGTGEEALPGKVVSAHYVGTLSDGTKFDSSIERGTPFEFTLGAGEVIKGWDLGIAGMKVGGARQLVISPELGYGAQALGPIPANSTLIFQVELVDVR